MLFMKQNITFDTLSAFKFFLGWEWGRSEPDGFLVSDDDTYINVRDLADFVYSEEFGKVLHPAQNKQKLFNLLYVQMTPHLIGDLYFQAPHHNHPVWAAPRTACKSGCL